MQDVHLLAPYWKGYTMANIIPGVLTTKIELDDRETKKLIDAADIASALVGLGVIVEPISTAIIGAWIRLNRFFIAKANKGNGVVLTIVHISIILSHVSSR